MGFKKPRLLQGLYKAPARLPRGFYRVDFLSFQKVFGGILKCF